MSKKGLLAVSFGTSHEDTREKTIDKIEKTLEAALPDRKLYRAWTSGMIIRKLKNEGIIIDTVPQALKRMADDGITDILVQPTHVLNGIENDIMLKNVEEVSGKFEKIIYSDPLMTSEEDNAAVAEVLSQEFNDIDENTALVFMGHGTTHYVNPVYAALDYRFKEMGRDNFYVATVEAYPTINNVISFLKDKPEIKRVVLTPFMIVAGDHAKNDMAGDDDSWKCILEREGYEVHCVIKGLGEYDGICNIITDHAVRAETINSTRKE